MAKIQDRLGRMFLEDIDFLLRFRKQANYHAGPKLPTPAKADEY